MADDSDAGGQLLDQVEQRFAANLRVVREDAGLSQDSVAARMRERGYTAFRQQTITRIENGERAVKFGEAAALAAVLGSELAELMRPTPLAQTGRMILAGAAMLMHETDQLSVARHHVASLRSALERLIREARDEGYGDQLAEEISVAEQALAAVGLDETEHASRKASRSRKTAG